MAPIGTQLIVVSLPTFLSFVSIIIASFALSQGGNLLDGFTVGLIETPKRIRSYHSESCSLEIQCSYDKGSEFQKGEF